MACYFHPPLGFRDSGWQRSIHAPAYTPEQAVDIFIQPFASLSFCHTNNSGSLIPVELQEPFLQHVVPYKVSRIAEHDRPVTG